MTEDGRKKAIHQLLAAYDGGPETVEIAARGILQEATLVDMLWIGSGLGALSANGNLALDMVSRIIGVISAIEDVTIH